ncbi:MAG: hypothetical protein AAB655_01095 [Patescibacteria group bacterium]
MNVLRFFDKIEDKVRGRLSRYPLIYAFLGGVGVVVFWRGVWHFTDFLSASFLLRESESSTIDLANGLDGLLSILVGTILLLLTGLFVSNFIGNEIIISGIKGDKKVSEKTEVELKQETSAIQKTEEKIERILKHVDQLDHKVIEYLEKINSRLDKK